MTKEEIRLKAVEYAFKKDAVSKEVITAYISGYLAASCAGIKGDSIGFLESLETTIRYNGNIENVKYLSEGDRETLSNHISGLRRILKERGDVCHHTDSSEIWKIC